VGKRELFVMLEKRARFSGRVLTSPDRRTLADCYEEAQRLAVTPLPGEPQTSGKLECAYVNEPLECMRERAAQCRKLAQTAHDERMVWQLKEWANEIEAHIERLKEECR